MQISGLLGRSAQMVGITAALITLLAVAGCGGTPQLMPTPTIYTHDDINPFEDVPPALQTSHVEVMYLTDRKPEESTSGSATYGYGRSRSVAFGVSDVEFGKNVSWDQLVAASRTSKRKISLPVHVVRTKEIVRYPETPRVLVEIGPRHGPGSQPTSTQVKELPPAQAQLKTELDAAREISHQALSERLAKTPDKEIYLFIHGYNNNFNDSVRMAAQLWHFLGRRGVPVAYSWPAGRGGLIRGYSYDRESSEFTVYHLKEMIRSIAEFEDVKKIHLISHSRGTGVLVSALSELHLQISGSGQPTRDVLKLGTVILAAPDIDLDVMIQRAVTMRLSQVPERVAVYVCANDQALGISNWLFGGITRFGSVRADMFSEYELTSLQNTKSVDIVDARVKDAGAFGHTYYYSNPAVSSDLIMLLRYQEPAGGKYRPLKRDDGPFWIIDDRYPGAVTIPAEDAPSPGQPHVATQ